MNVQFAIAILGVGIAIGYYTCRLKYKKIIGDSIASLNEVLEVDAARPLPKYMYCVDPYNFGLDLPCVTIFRQEGNTTKEIAAEYAGRVSSKLSIPEQMAKSKYPSVYPIIDTDKIEKLEYTGTRLGLHGPGVTEQLIEEEKEKQKFTMSDELRADFEQLSIEEQQQLLQEYRKLMQS